MPNFLVTSTIAAGPTRLSSTTITCRKATVLACKGLDGPTASPNSGLVKLGRSGTANQQPIEMDPGAERSLGAAEQGRMDLSKYFFVVASDGDGLVVEYDS